MPFIHSRAIRRVEWREGTLSIRFRDGDRYDHVDVPERVFNALLSSGSAGAFFQEHVRDPHAFRRHRGA